MEDLLTTDKGQAIAECPDNTMFGHKQKSGREKEKAEMKKIVQTLFDREEGAMRNKGRKMISEGIISVFALALICSLPQTLVFAAVPATINYQGYLTNSGGTAIDSTVPLTFRIYNVSTGGTALWTETQPSVVVSKGVYSVQLGSVTSLGSLAFDQQYYLGVQVGGDPEMTPRQALTSVPYALRAGKADETDPTVNTLGKASLICAADQTVRFNGSEWVCSTGITTETDPTVNTLGKAALTCAAEQIAKFNGSAWICASDSGITSESDPKVGSNTTNYVPKWNGSALVSGSIYDNGNIAIGAAGSAVDKLLVYRPDGDFGEGKTGIYGYRHGSSNAFGGGSGWSINYVDAAIKGASIWGNQYSAGLAGYNNLDYANSAAVVGAMNDGSNRGMLGHKDNNGNLWAGHFEGNVKVAGGALSLASPLSIANGGTGATTASGALTNLGAASGDHNHDSVYQKKYAKVAVVSQSGGDYTDPVTAMTNFASWCGTSSSTNPCLLKIMPGVYNIGSNSLQMQQYVDIEGSGENTTKITGNVTGSGFGLVTGASNAEIRFLTVENNAMGDSATAIYNTSASPKITSVTAKASGAGNCFGVFNSGSSPIMTNVTAKASGWRDSYGIYNGTSSSIMTNVTAEASGDISSMSSYGIYNGTSSPIMTNVTAKALSLGGLNWGVYNVAASPTMTNVTVTSDYMGIYNDSSSPIMTNVTVTSDFMGIHNFSSSPIMTNVTAKGIYYGMRSVALSGSYTIIADRCTFEGSTYSIYNDDEFILRIGASKLVGAANASGTYTCVGAYDGNTYLPLNSLCK